MKIPIRISRIIIADRVFMNGDDLLMSDIMIELGENERSSNCSFTIHDPSLVIGAEFQKMSIDSGGILVPDELINEPKQEPPQNSNSTDSDKGTLQTSGGGNVEANIQLLVNECKKQGVTDRRQIAYVLATVQHECNFEPISEYGGSSARYAPWYGRGFVQLTWETNYQKYSKILGQDFIKNPDGVKEPRAAAFICVHGMRTGNFTGAKLSDYINSSKKDYYGARTIVNGTDQASRIAQYAEEWEKKLDKYLGASTVQTTAPTENTPQNVNTPVQQSPISENSIKGTEIIIQLGYDLNNLIDFHFIHTETVSKIDRGHFTTFGGKTIRWLLTRKPQTTAYKDVTLKQITDITARSYGIEATVIGGGSKYGFLDQTNLTPYQLLLREAKAIGYRIADDTKNKLILEPEGKPIFKNFVVDYEHFISATFTDKARGSKPIPYQAISDPYTGTNQVKFQVDRKSGKVEQIKPESYVGLGATRTLESALQTGTATGGSPSQVTGTSKGTLGDNPQRTVGFTDQVVQDQFQMEPIKNVDSEFTDENGNKVKKNIVTEISKKRGEIIKGETVTEIKISGGTEQKTIKKTVTIKTVIFDNADKPVKQKTTVTKDINGVKTETIKESTEIDSELNKTLELKTTPPTTEANYGLPKQISGILDLEDGKAEAQVISDEARRIRGYESTIVLMASTRTLQIVPGEIIGISSEVVPEPFNREWRVYSVKHDWKSQTTTLIVYTPQGLKEDDSKVSGGTSTDTSSVNVQPGALSVPCITQRDNAIDPQRTCNTSSCFMALAFLKPGVVKSDDEYYQRVIKYGDTTSHSAQSQALASYGLSSTWSTNLDFADLDASLARGKPIVIGINHRGTESNPTGGHMCVIVGKTPDGNGYYVNDPYGDLNTNYSTGDKACAVVYTKKQLNARWKLEGSNSGWGRIF